MLLSKGDNPSTTVEYRFIACCSIIYKVITKLLSVRIQSALSSLVDISQTAFVSGRNIIHNVMMGAELVRLYKGSKVSP